MPQDDISKYKIDQLESAVVELRQSYTTTTAELRADNRKLHDEIEKLRADEAEKERKLLLWGLMTLGAIVSTLGTILWGIMKGKIL